MENSRNGQETDREAQRQHNNTKWLLTVMAGIAAIALIAALDAQLLR